MKGQIMKNYSKQREEILNVLKNSKSHLTAEEIYSIVKKNNSTASRGTVYRNLNLLTGKSIIKRISICNGPDKYDFINKKHNHIICSKCGKVFDFYYNLDFNLLKKAIKNQTEITEVEADIILQGICNDCKKAIK